MMEEINSFLSSLESEKGLKLLVVSGCRQSLLGGRGGGRPPWGSNEYDPNLPSDVQVHGRLESPVSLWSTGPPWEEDANWLLNCDLVLATEKARFGQPEIQVGVSSDRSAWFSRG